MSDEIWKPIPQFPGYEASSEGRIRTTKTNTRCKDPDGILGVRYSDGGRASLYLRRGGKAVGLLRAAVVCAAFHGARPGPGFEVDHIDLDPSHDVPSNLRWLERAQHKKRHAAERGSRWRPAAREAIRLINDGEDASAACEQAGIMYGRLRDLVRQAPAWLPPLDEPLPKKPRKLRPGAVAKMKAALAAGVSGARLAQFFEVSESMVSRIRSRDRFAEVEPADSYPPELNDNSQRQSFVAFEAMANDVNRAPGERLGAWVLTKGSRQRAATLIGISGPTLAKAINGETPRTIMTMLKIEAATGVRPQDWVKKSSPGA